MVFVVWLFVVEGHFQYLTNDTTEENSLLLSVFWLVTKVRQQLSVEQLVDTSLSVFLLLSCSEFLLQPFVSLSFGLDFELFVVVNFVNIGYNVLECGLWTGNSSEDFTVNFDSESTHEKNDWNRRGSSGADLHHEHTISSLLNSEWFSHSILLGENLCNLGSLGGSLVDFNRDTVWSKIFH